MAGYVQKAVLWCVGIDREVTVDEEVFHQADNYWLSDETIDVSWLLIGYLF
jgi:hypothetical protein